MTFQAATEYVRSLPKDGPVQLSNEEKLRFYLLLALLPVLRLLGAP